MGTGTMDGRGGIGSGAGKRMLRRPIVPPT